MGSERDSLIMTYLCLLEQLRVLTVVLQMQDEAGEKKGFLQLCPDLWDDVTSFKTANNPYPFLNST